MARFAGLQTRFGEECGVSSAPNPLECSVSQPGKVSGATPASDHGRFSTRQSDHDLTQTLNAGPGVNL